MGTIVRWSLGGCAMLLACACSRAATSAGEIIPLVHAHAHNDYEHHRPLLDALEHGFTSVEADIHLVDGRLLVGHDVEDAQQSLQELYLEPLRQRVAENGGSVYPGGQGFILLIDIKSEAETTYRALDALLQQYRNMLTAFGPQEAIPGAVSVVVSGNRPRELMEGQEIRYAAYDGRLNDLETSAPASLVFMISEKWTDYFTWNGRGVMPEAERARLKEFVAAAHANGRLVRFWAMYDKRTRARTALWQVLLDAGVDLINTDDLEGLQGFLLANDPTLAGR
jgi:hypothetical protein